MHQPTTAFEIAAARDVGEIDNVIVLNEHGHPLMIFRDADPDQQPPIWWPAWYSVIGGKTQFSDPLNSAMGSLAAEVAILVNDERLKPLTKNVDEHAMGHFVRYWVLPYSEAEGFRLMPRHGQSARFMTPEELRHIWIIPSVWLALETMGLVNKETYVPMGPPPPKHFKPRYDF